MLQSSVFLKAPLALTAVIESTSGLMFTADVVLTCPFVANHHVALCRIASHDLYHIVVWILASLDQ